MEKIASEMLTLNFAIEEKNIISNIIPEKLENGTYLHSKADYSKHYVLADFEEDDYKKILGLIKSNFRHFYKYLPMFGEYEIDKIIKTSFLHSLIIARDFTDLFNMELFFSDHSTKKITPEYLKEKLLPCFEIKKVVNNTTYLKFKWEYYINTN